MTKIRIVSILLTPLILFCIANNAYAERNRSGKIAGTVVASSSIAIGVHDSASGETYYMRVTDTSSFNPVRLPKKAEKVEAEYESTLGGYNLVSIQILEAIPSNTPRVSVGRGMFRTTGEVEDTQPNKLILKEDYIGLSDEFLTDKNTLFVSGAPAKGDRISIDFRPTLKGNIAEIVRLTYVSSASPAGESFKKNQESIDVSLSDINWLVTATDEISRFTYKLQVVNYEDVPVKVELELTLRDEADTKLGTAEISLDAEPNSVSKHSGTGSFPNKIRGKGILKEIRIKSTRLR